VMSEACELLGRAYAGEQVPAAMPSSAPLSSARAGDATEASLSSPSLATTRRCAIEAGESPNAGDAGAGATDAPSPLRRALMLVCCARTGAGEGAGEVEDAGEADGGGEAEEDAETSGTGGGANDDVEEGSAEESCGGRAEAEVAGANKADGACRPFAVNIEDAAGAADAAEAECEAGCWAVACGSEPEWTCAGAELTFGEVRTAVSAREERASVADSVTTSSRGD
jgi:hypothetical protein